MRIRRSHISVLAAALGVMIVAAPALADDVAAPAKEPVLVAEELAPAPLQHIRLAEEAPTIEAELREFARRPPARGTTNPDESKPPTPKPPRQLPPPKLQCTSAGVEAFVRQYTIAFNRGKMRKVRSFFARRTVPIVRDQDGSPQVVDGDVRGFRWYTVAATNRGLTQSVRRYFIGRNRNRVAKYVQLRRKKGERLRYVTTTGFQALDVGGVPHAGVAFLVKRRANDLLPRKRWRTVKGKALIDCQSGKISVFSI